MRPRSSVHRALLRHSRDDNSSSINIDYKDVKLLSSFLSERGKIIPSRITSIPKKYQRSLSLAIKRARRIALIPYVIK